MSSMYNHGELVSESDKLIESASSNPHAVEIMSFPVSDDSHVCVVKLMVGSSLEKDLEISTQNSLYSDRIIGDSRIVSTILTGQERFKPFGDSAMEARGIGFFSGNYGFFCAKSQEFERENITLKEFDDIRWKAFGVCFNKCVWYGRGLNTEEMEKTSPLNIPENYAEISEEEIKTSSRILVAKTFNINFRKSAANGESREGYITITSDGYYEGKINFRCNCSSFFCACNFDSARIELRNSSNTTVVSVPFDPDSFDLGKASDSDKYCKGWNRLIAQAYNQIVFADPMFRSN